MLKGKAKEEDEKKFCKGCEEYVDELHKDWGIELCKECNDSYINVTGHCSLSCCLGYGCDESC